MSILLIMKEEAESSSKSQCFITFRHMRCPEYFVMNVIRPENFMAYYSEKDSNPVPPE
jgi:hypothetical protein